MAHFLAGIKRMFLWHVYNTIALEYMSLQVFYTGNTDCESICKYTCRWWHKQLKKALGERRALPSDEIEGFKTFLDPDTIVYIGSNTRSHNIVGCVMIKAPLAYDPRTDWNWTS